MSKQYEADFSYSNGEYIVAAKDKNDKPLNKPFRTKNGPKKFSVYVKNKKGNIVKVNFGDPNMEIKRDDPERRKAFRARHNCDSKKDKTTPGYWSCKMWSKKSVTSLTKASSYVEAEDWDGETLWREEDLIKDLAQKDIPEITEEGF